MAELIKADNISSGWLKGMDYLITHGGTESNLIIEIESDAEIAPVRNQVDEFLTHYELDAIHRVADTIFPIDFYRGEPGIQAREHLYKCQRMAARFERRFIGITYFDRLIDWPHLVKSDPEVKTWNQLEYRILLIKSAWDRELRTFNVGELGLSSGLSEDIVADVTGDLRTFHASTDRSLYGFPCLSHISLTLFKGRLDLTATYRNQHYINKAYGNFVGLMRLLKFISSEVGCSMGKVICNATHADAEISKNGVPKLLEISNLLNTCKSLAKE